MRTAPIETSPFTKRSRHLRSLNPSRNPCGLLPFQEEPPIEPVLKLDLEGIVVCEVEAVDYRE